MKLRICVYIFLLTFASVANAQNAPKVAPFENVGNKLEAPFSWTDLETHELQTDNDDRNTIPEYRSFKDLLDRYLKASSDANPVSPNNKDQPATNSESRIIYTSQEQGMIGLFNMVKIFLNDIVVPNTIDDLIEEYNVEKLSDLGDIELTAWFELFMGILILACVGVAFILFFPIVWCICSCCSCCVSCCAKILCCCCNAVCKGPSICSVIFWTVSSTVIVVFLLASVICNFVAVSLIQEQIDGGLTNGMIDGLTNIEAFLDTSVKDLKFVTLSETSSMKHQVFDALDEFPGKTLDELDSTIQAGAPLTELNSFAGNMSGLQLALVDMDAFNYEILRDEIDDELSNITQRIKTKLDNCDSDKCKQAKQDAERLESNATYEGLSDQTTAAAIAVDQAIQAGIDDAIHTFYGAYIEIPDTINNAMEYEVAEMKNAIREIEANLEDQLDTIEENVNDIDFEKAIDTIDDIQNYYMDYGNYLVTVPSFTIACITLSIVCLYIFGIFFGTILCSTWRLPSICITIANIMQFIFLWLFMIFVVTYFGAGGGVETAACRHLVVYDDTMDSLARLVRNENDISYNGSIKNVVDNCYNNETVYKAMNLADNGFNITEIADLEQYGIYDKIDEIEDIEIDISDVEIINKDVSDAMDTLDRAFKAVNFAEYNIENAKPILKTSLEEYIILLTQVEQEEPTIDIKDEREELENILENRYVDMDTEKTNIEKGTIGAQRIIEGVDLPQIVGDLDSSQDAINDDANDVLSGELVDIASQLLTTVDDYASSLAKGVEDDIGQCFNLFAAIRSFIHTPCVHTLYPLNAIWFCLGWYIAFSIPAIVFTKFLQGIFSDKRLAGDSDNKIV